MSLRTTNQGPGRPAHATVLGLDLDVDTYPADLILLPESLRVRLRDLASYSVLTDPAFALRYRHARPFEGGHSLAENADLAAPSLLDIMDTFFLD